MKIKFKKKRLYLNLALGILWTGIGIYNIMEVENLHWMDFAYLAVGTLYLLHYLYDYQHQYLSIENGTIRKNALYGYSKKINLNHICLIRKSGGDYLLQTENQKMKINPELVEDASLYELTNVLEKLKLSPDKNPFAKVA